MPTLTLLLGCYTNKARSDRRYHAPTMHRPMQGWPRYVPTAPPAVTLDELERFLVGVFLRRYVTYCVRRRRSASANGAARLYRKIVAR